MKYRRWWKSRTFITVFTARRWKSRHYLMVAKSHMPFYFILAQSSNISPILSVSAEALRFAAKSRLSFCSKAFLTRHAIFAFSINALPWSNASAISQRSIQPGMLICRAAPAGHKLTARLLDDAKYRAMARCSSAAVSRLDNEYICWATADMNSFVMRCRHFDG